jgi:hypothetical protein
MSHSTAPVVGSPAPALVGTTVDGATFDLAAPRKRAILVEFLRGTW